MSSLMLEKPANPYAYTNGSVEIQKKTKGRDEKKKKREKLEAEMKMVTKQRESYGETNSLIHNL